MKKTKIILRVFLVLLTMTVYGQKQKSKPNIVYILADDMGYGDVSGLNPDSKIPTPYMDKMIKDGVHFTNAHSNSAVCTPSRYGILTGRYTWRTKLKRGVLLGYSEPLIESNRLTIASYLKTKGYNTACIGKWHLGLGYQPKDEKLDIEGEKGDQQSNVDWSKKITGPNELGFDYSYIMPGSLGMPPYVYIKNGKVEEEPTNYSKGKWRAGEIAPSFVHEKTLGHFKDEAISYIKNQKKSNTPFFLYFALTAPHKPILPTGDAVGKSKAGSRGDFVVMVDHVVGEVVKTLTEMGKIDNTLIIVTSDNGANETPAAQIRRNHNSSYIFKGMKGDIYEGGHRIPYIARFDGVIPSGHKSSQLLSTTDLIATVAGLLNSPVPTNAAEDSWNLWPAYVSNVKKPIAEAEVHHSYTGMFAITKGKWKYTEGLGSGGLGGKFKKEKVSESKEEKTSGTLYDMEKDPEEKVDLYTQHPEIVKELSDLLNKYRTESSSNGIAQETKISQ